VTVLVDADVLVAALDATDARHEAARRRFESWNDAAVPRIVSVVNLSEVLVAPAATPSTLSRAREAIAALGVTGHRPTEGVAVEAARLRARHPISLPDAYLLATARATGALVASFDRRLLRFAEAEGLAADGG